MTCSKVELITPIRLERKKMMMIEEGENGVIVKEERRKTRGRTGRTGIGRRRREK
jgi:hypothetical protein